MIKDINPGTGNSNPQWLINLNGILYFTATDAGANVELWKSDGTQSGTVMVKDIRPGTSGSHPTFLIRMGNALYFQADNGIHGGELWKSDGTAEGTVMIKDIYPGTATNGSYPRNLTANNNIVYFQAMDAASGAELWKTDGTSTGTVMVKDINPGAVNHSSPQTLLNVNGTLYFAANNGANGLELWKSDGTAEGTFMVKDISSGAANSFSVSFSYLVNLNGTLYFPANDGVNGAELWRSNGTAAGTSLVTDLHPSGSSQPWYLFVTSNNKLLFQATEPSAGLELYLLEQTGPEIEVSQGTSALPISSTFDFGNVNLTEPEVALTFTVANTGASDLSLTGLPAVTLTGTHATDFSIVSQPAATSLTPGTNTTFTVKFTPAATGVRTAQVMLPTNDSDENPFVLNLKGNGMKQSQSVSFQTLPQKTYGEDDFSLNAATSSGLPLTYSSSNPAVAQVSGQTVTIIGAGVALLTASQTGNDQYDAATPVSQTFTVQKASLTATAGSHTRSYGTANPALVVYYTGFARGEDTSAIRQPQISTWADETTTPGTYPIALSGGSASNYQINLQPGTLTITKAIQTIQFIPLSDRKATDGSLELSATASSRLPVTFRVVSGPATLSGNALTLTGEPGMVTVAAAQTGDDNYEPAPEVRQCFNVDCTVASPLTLANAACGARSITLSATGGSDGSYRWYSQEVGGEVIAGAVSGTFTTPVLASTDTFFVAIREGACESKRVAVVATIKAQPPQPTITENAEAFTLVSSSPSGNQWLMDGAEIPGATHQTLPISKAGSYTVKVTLTDCTSISNPVSLTATESPLFTKGLELYPNPATDRIVVTFQPATPVKAVQVSLINGVGAVIQQGINMASHNDGWQLELNTAQLPAGSYLLRFRTQHGFAAKRFVKK
jgi:ELWxxDGT repeat protein